MSQPTQASATAISSSSAITPSTSIVPTQAQSAAQRRAERLARFSAIQSGSTLSSATQSATGGATGASLLPMPAPALPTIALRAPAPLAEQPLRAEPAAVQPRIAAIAPAPSPPLAPASALEVGVSNPPVRTDRAGAPATATLTVSQTRAEIAAPAAAPLSSPPAIDIEAVRARQEEARLLLRRLTNQVEAHEHCTKLRADIQRGIITGLEFNPTWIEKNRLALDPQVEENRPFLQLIDQTRTELTGFCRTHYSGYRRVIEALPQLEARRQALRLDRPADAEGLLVDIVRWSLPQYVSSQGNFNYCSQDLVTVHLFKQLSEMHRSVTAWLRLHTPAAPASAVRELTLQLGNTRVVLTQGDLIKQRVEAIVFPGNENFQVGSFHCNTENQFVLRGGPDAVLALYNLPRRDRSGERRPGIGDSEVRCRRGRAIATPCFNLQNGDLLQEAIHTAIPNEFYDNRAVYNEVIKECLSSCLNLAQHSRKRSLALSLPLVEEHYVPQYLRQDASWPGRGRNLFESDVVQDFVPPLMQALQAWFIPSRTTTLQEVRLVVHRLVNFERVAEAARGVLAFQDLAEPAGPASPAPTALAVPAPTITS